MVSVAPAALVQGPIYVHSEARERRHRHYGTAVAPRFGQVRPPGGCRSPYNTICTFHRCLDNETLFQLALHAETPLNLFHLLNGAPYTRFPAQQQSGRLPTRLDRRNRSFPPGYPEGARFKPSESSGWLGAPRPHLQLPAQHTDRYSVPSHQEPANDTACRCAGGTEVAALCLNQTFASTRRCRDDHHPTDR